VCVLFKLANANDAQLQLSHPREYCDTWMRTSLIPTAVIRALLIKYVKVDALLTQPSERDRAAFAVDEALSTPAVTVYRSHDRSQGWVWLTTGRHGWRVAGVGHVSMRDRFF
jgi:hypothetical protein